MWRVGKLTLETGGFRAIDRLRAIQPSEAAPADVNRSTVSRLYGLEERSQQ
jgi:hypothetical protein